MERKKCVVIEQVLRFEHRNDFRKWLGKHADNQSFCLVILSRKNSENGLIYLDAVKNHYVLDGLMRLQKRCQMRNWHNAFHQDENGATGPKNKERVRR